MSIREVTERDFRKEEFFNAKVEDYEFRDDGKIVRKDRWISAVNHIACILRGINSRAYEIPDVIDRVQELQDGVNLKNNNDMIYGLLVVHFSGDNYVSDEKRNKALQGVLLEFDLSDEAWDNFKNSDYSIEWLGDEKLAEIERLIRE